MRGLLNQQQPQRQMEQPQPGPPQQQDPQEAFDKLVINALKILHDPVVAEKNIARIKKDPDTVAGVGDVAIDVLNRLIDSARESGIAFDLPVIANGLNVIVGEIINICEAAGANPLNEEQRYQAFSWAMSKFLDSAVKAGEIAPEELAQMAQEMEQMAMQEGAPEGESPSVRQGQPQKPQISPSPQSQGGT